MISVQVDEKEVRNLYLAKVEEMVKEIDAELVYWDSNELKRRTCMGWNTIQKEFFFDPRFPKYKVGGKWYFPAQQVKEFLLQWLSEH
ncbi:group-specific protein [Bacillus thuringiensis]|uniref:group-specific protein n=1 Tax=Bacillus thuringiensis TaxID=1428 RepID=UPI000BF85925|nr:group-specific protein [Bacillus thuringiensis]PFB52466.1 group-specific protein [Bacillus thuringiensis]